MLTARQVSAMIGPETPGCDCAGCKDILTVKALVCDPVTSFSDGQSADDAAMPWLLVLMVAASRLRAQGVDPRVLATAAARGVDQTEILNPLLCWGGVTTGATPQ